MSVRPNHQFKRSRGRDQELEDGDVQSVPADEVFQRLEASLRK